VNAAYETLSDPGRRHAYDLALQAPAGNPAFAPPPGHARKYSQRRNPAANRATRAGRAGMSHEAIYQKYAPLGSRACWVLVVFGLLLALDRACVQTFLNEEVLRADTWVKYNRRGRPIGSVTTIETPNASFSSENEYKVGDVLALQRTPLFGQVISRQYQKGYDSSPIEASDQLYRGAPLLLPITMFLTALVGAWPGRAGRRQMDCALTAGILAVIVLWLLFRF
jgi:hypothetical protein